MPSSHPIRSVHTLPVLLALVVVLVLAAASFVANPARAADAATPVKLRTAEQFAVLAGAGITNTGSTTIQGDIGSFPTTDQTIPDVTLDGTNQGGNSVTQGAKDDLVAAYDEARDALPPTAVETELGGRSLVAGVYRAPVTLGLTGTLTLDGGRTDGKPSNSVFIFQSPTTLITEVDSQVVLTGGAQACNIFWQVGSAATFKSGTDFQGTVMAYTEAITAGKGATFVGRLLARTSAVTLNNNTITRPTCETGPTDDGDTDRPTDDGPTDDDDTDGGTDEGETGGTGPDDGDTDGTDGDGTPDSDGGDDTTADDPASTPVADTDSGTSGGSSDTPSATTDGPRATGTDLPSAGGPPVWAPLAGLVLVGAGCMLVRQRGRPAHRA